MKRQPKNHNTCFRLHKIATQIYERLELKVGDKVPNEQMACAIMGMGITKYRQVVACLIFSGHWSGFHGRPSVVVMDYTNPYFVNRINNRP